MQKKVSGFFTTGGVKGPVLLALGRAHHMDDARIVVVEDEQIISKDIQSYLQRFGYQVAGAAASGEEAVELVKKRQPDLVLMDVMLKGEMLGTEAADIIREQFNIPVVYLTAHADRDTLDRAKITEPYGYVLKPFDEHELQTAIKMALYKHKAEQEKLHLQEQLMQMHKLEAIGHLTTGVAHNFNNALNVIMGNLELVRMRDDPAIAAYLNRAWDASESAAKLVEGLLAFCRARDMAGEIFDAYAVARQASDMCRQSLKGEIVLDLALSHSSCPVLGDATQIQQVILNLCLNARDALYELKERKLGSDRMPRIAVRVSRVERGGSSFACIEVKDNGVGMSKETQQHIFEPFFTTKSVDRGTGLGLATAYGVVQDHRGLIECDSYLGQATTFAVYLPIAETDEDEEKEGDLSAPEDAHLHDRSAARILVVDDEELVRDTTHDLLEFEGYEVMLAVDGLDGWQQFQEKKDQIDLVLLDLSMPKLSGLEVLDRIVNLKSDARVIIITGDPPESIDAPKARLVLGKPLISDVLFTAVRQVLNDEI